MNVLKLGQTASIYHKDVPWCSKNVSPSEKIPTLCKFRFPPLSLKFYSIAILKRIKNDEQNILAIGPNASIYHRNILWSSKNVLPSEKISNFFHV